MSLMPFLLDDIRPGQLFDQHFGLGMLTDDLVHPLNSMVGPLRLGYYRPWRHQHTRRSGVSNVKNDKESFKVNLDVQQFTPEEITVKTVDNFVVIEGKHEERQDEHGYISRNFQRRYKLPAECEPETVKSELSSDGVLTITAPKKALPPSSGTERVIPITQTNTPAVKAAENQEKMEQ
ncbi:protein lethal(2)essential for life-like [Periplaneta americana]|uniref:protein lethal(2)essential for life-like n=1 Tax=Periplaneta americana TaxID=6978 RepID=UPI0037E75342